ncbi:MAG: hypothetical protein P8Y16_01460, partial [Sulfurimonas sp.]
MKDTIIINTISKIHAAIVSFLSFIFLTLFIGFIVLQNGLYLEDFSISNINIKKLYLKWDHKLNLYVEHLNITSKKSNQTSPALTKRKLLQYSKSFYQVVNLFNSIVISDFRYNKLQGKLNYKIGEKLTLSAHSKNLQLNTEIAVNKDYSTLHIKQFKYKDFTANGNIYLNPFTLKVFSKVDVSIMNDANITLYTSSDDTQLGYKVISHNSIQDIKAIMHQIPFPKSI